MPEKNITFEIVQHLGVITRFDSGWNRELNIISWNGNTPKYDIRDWDPHHERMKKGITLHEAEFHRVVDLYLHNNSQKAVERGRALDEERRARRRDSFAEAAGTAEERNAEAEAFVEIEAPPAFPEAETSEPWAEGAAPEALEAEPEAADDETPF